MLSYRIHETGNTGSAKIEDVAGLLPEDDEIIVDVAAAAVGFVDTLVVSGRYQNIPPTPFTPGMEFSGWISAVGSKIAGYKPGDRVTAYVLNGAFAQQAKARVGEFYPVPADVPLDQAALLCGAYLTGYFALVERGQFKAGDTVLVGGASGAVGLATVQIAKALGAGLVIGTYRSPEDREALHAAGTDAEIDVSGSDVREALRSTVLELTDGKGVDLVIDPIGGEFLNAALRSIAWSGRLVVVGFAAGDIPSIKVNYLLLKNIAVVGLDVSQYRKRAAERLALAQGEIFELWRKGLVRPRVARQFAFEHIGEALDLVAKGQTHGRAVIILGDGKL
ncbi:NADPH:quinone oxidoreductase family protein (plasmid) [Agrobacterium tumefaciens]|jgi:NADPH2:quinone reductase|uniref:NADPH:quinone oxidoreductase family protein n=1 Tax=Agrobacterium tumefaciens TaxID=358 RepID=UPI001573C896|nr:NADPH:quinone oxidoreductase family protein [Agrobacterium tumefaciens]NSZ77513.1 NADPH:quinone oxidoreductase family protein [Agrobacterium tumefaciens]NSZ87898.1 NADPH:quinone oxidoreductase family protein [Agrobacterium tumefaciens]WCA72640.1 NADPH:quinone oxidoreductase family protein [Agrobacterium tumefaciens]